MRHHVQLLMGRCLESAAHEIPLYTMTNGVQEARPFVHTLLWTHDEDGNITVSASECFIESDFVLEPEVRINKFEDIKDVTDKNIQRFLKSLYQQIVTIDNPGQPSNLLLTITIPLWDNLLIEDSKSILSVLGQIDLDYEVDVIGLDAELATELLDDEASLSSGQIQSLNQKGWKSLFEVVQTNTKGNIKHMIPLQNTNGQAALMFNMNGLSHVLAQWGLLCVECYSHILPQNFEPQHELTALGLSVLHLDKHFFVKYLLARAFVHVLERESVTQEKVDVNKIAPIAQCCIQNGDLKHDLTKLFSSFWQQEVTPLLESHQAHSDIIARLSPKLTQLFQVTLLNQLQSYIKDESLTLPERKCILALVLGLDDKQLEGNIFNSHQLNVEDIAREPLQLFVDQLNKEDSVSPTLLSIADDEGKLEIPTDKLRSIKGQMRDSTRYIRQQAERLEILKSQIDDVKESKRRLTEDGFLFEGQTFKLLPEITEQTFDEDYEGHDNLPLAVDLRDSFTEIRNQGELGSCSTFASVAVMEYLMKKNEQESDLSEAFVYYNARKSEGEEDKNTGTSIYSAITSMHDLGICLERLKPYDVHDYATPPSEEALQDALNRRVVSAKNLRLNGDLDHNINLIKSALADGFPVVFAINIYDSFDASFDKSRGFIHSPSEEEINSYYEKHGDDRRYHAMTICGYSDDQRIFIVRNSWGMRFGDKGYCYLPYSYVGDSKLSRQFCIITEVLIPAGTTKTTKALDEKEKHVQFDQTDALIDIAITSVLLDEERVHLKNLEDTYKRLQVGYRSLLSQLCNNRLRTQLTQNACKALDDQIQTIEQEILHLQNNRSEALASHDQVWDKHLRWLLLSGGLSVVASCSFGYYMLQKPFVVFAIIALLIGVFGILYYSYMRSHRKQIEQEYHERVNQLVNRKTRLVHDRQIVELKMHFAGIFIEQFDTMRSKLNTKYHCMASFLGNLNTWFEEQTHALNTMDSHSQMRTFISVLDNTQLDKFFDENAKDVTNLISLASFFDDYSMDEEGILAFRKNLEQELTVSLLKILQGFSMNRYITQSASYPFLRESDELSEIIQTMNQRSNPFAQYKQVESFSPDVKHILIHADDEQEKRSWHEAYRRFFNIAPNENYMISPFQLIVICTKEISLNELYTKSL